jgi:protein-S-isoprenylcysteine O-methyltransferase Ste14
MRMTRSVITSVVWFCAMGAALFVPAGTLAWRGGWIFMGEMVLASIASVAWLAKYDPGLLKERLGAPIQKGQTSWDKVLSLALVVFWYGWMVLMALDVKRWHFSAAPDWVTYTGAVLIPLGFLAVLRTFRENSFAAPVVRIQQERGHKVIDTGPYALVRHPMYAGAFLYVLGTPLVLGSWLGLAALPVIMGLLIIRIFIEEAALRKGLPGYAEYATRVRYRLVPGVW